MTATLVDIAVKATALFAAGVAADWMLRRGSAATRHVLWVSVLAGALLLPLLSVALPGWRIPVRAGAVQEVLARVDALPAQGAAADPAAWGPVPAGQTRRTPPDLLVALWLAGAALCLARVGLSAASAERLRRRAGAAPPSIAARAPGTPVVIAGRRMMPLAAGLWRPSVVLPEAALNWPKQRLEAVLQHELAHIRRRDTSWQLLCSVACAVFWPHPLAWHASRRALHYRERAADDAVLASGAAAHDYAVSLLEIARTLAAPRFSEGAAMARPSELEGRLMAVLDERRDRRPAARGLVLAVSTITLAAVLGLAAFKPAPAQQGPAVPAVEQARERLVAAERAAGPQSAEFGEALVALGRELSLAGDEKSASSMFQRAVETLQQAAPGGAAFAEALYRTAVYANESNEGGRARDFYQRALEAARASGELRVVARAAHNLAVLLGKKDPAQAERYLNEAIDNESDPGLQANSLQLLTDLLVQSGRNTEAEVVTQRATQARERIAVMPAVQPGPDVHRIGGPISAPALRSKIEPAYSAEARAAKLQGTVLIALEVGADGVPRNVQLRRRIGLGLDESAVRAVQAWRFQPARDQSNQPVAVLANVEVNFRLL